jgi:VanZ family protein
LFKFIEKRKVLLVYTPLVLYWVLLLTATSLPANDIPALGLYDKFYHLGAYTVLSFLLSLTLIFQRKSKFLFEKAGVAAIVISSVYGALDEIHQLFVPGRSAEILDWTADLIGACIGVYIIYLMIKRFKYPLEFS